MMAEELFVTDPELLRRLEAGEGAVIDNGPKRPKELEKPNQPKPELSPALEPSAGEAPLAQEVPALFPSLEPLAGEQPVPEKPEAAPPADPGHEFLRSGDRSGPNIKDGG